MSSKILKAFWNFNDENESSASHHSDHSSPPVVTQSPKPINSNSKMRQHLTSVMNNANLPGFDYIEFKEAMQEVADEIPNVATRMRTVFKTAKSMQVTVQTLIDAANHYIKVLTEDKKNFEGALVDKVNNEIGDQKKQLDSVNLMIKNCEKQIDDLNARIAKGQSEKDKLTSEISTAESRVQSSRSEYVIAFDEICGIIKDDIKEIKANLGVAK